MTNPAKNPTNIPATSPGLGGTQLGLLLDTAKDMLSEEIRRTDRLETRSRHMITACGALFAVALTATAGILNALITAANGKIDNLDGWVVPVLGVGALVAVVTLLLAFAWTLEVQKVRRTGVLEPETIDGYITWAEKGHVAVAKYLISTYADLLRSRRAQNDKRACVLRRAVVACCFAGAASCAQLAAVLVALLSS